MTFLCAKRRDQNFNIFCAFAGQNLETFFLDVVRRAQQASVDTAGARAGGRVADYLLAGREERQGPVALEALADRGDEAAGAAAAPDAGLPPAPVVDEKKLAALAEGAERPAAAPAVPAAPAAEGEALKEASARLKSLLNR